MSNASTPIVFVVDSDPSVRESLELLIRAAGWQAETFASAKEFLARPRSVVASCLVLDVTLPDLNGLELQERIASERTDMPIIFLTGNADIAMTVRAMKRGFSKQSNAARPRWDVRTNCTRCVRTMGRLLNGNAK
jgi:FixJ family two-component response regulator